MWTSNVCSSLPRSQLGTARLGTLLRHLPSFASVSKPTSVKQLIASTFHKARALFKFALGKSPAELGPKLSNYSVAIRNVADTVAVPSLLGRVVVGKQFPIRRFNAFFENTRFRMLNRKHLTGTGITLGLVGVCVRDDNGYPMLLPDSANKMFSWNQVFQALKSHAFELKDIREDIDNVDCITFKDCISKGCNGVVYKAEVESRDNKSQKQEVAVKMLFNYDIQSNSTMIINAYIKECVPYNGNFGGYDVKRKRLPPHQGVVKVLSAFVSDFQPLGQCKQLYPQALPLKYGGYGRNMTLFVVQKLYDMNLKNYLDLYKPSHECSLAILTQCLDALDFMSVNSISHRDLKADNILVSLSEEEYPWVVISDFGLCSTSLVLPFQTDEVCRGGNRALMAPEIINAKPAPRAVLDYSKSDLWSMGTIAYEIFGANNPFYKANPNSVKLFGASYTESLLPPFPTKARLLKALIRQILSREPAERPTTAFAADLCQLLFHMGAKKVNQLVRLSDRQMRTKLVDDWFKSFTYRTIYQTMNGCEQKSFKHKMSLIFLTKLQLEKVQQLVDDVNLYLTL